MLKATHIALCFALTLPLSAVSGEKFPVDGSPGVVLTGDHLARAGFGKTRNSLSSIENVRVVDRGNSVMFQFVADDRRVRSCNTIDPRYMRLGRSVNRNDELEILLTSGAGQVGGICSIVKNRKSTRYQLSQQ